LFEANDKTLKAYVAGRSSYEIAFAAYQKANAGYQAVDEAYQTALVGRFFLAVLVLITFGVMAKDDRASIGLAMPLQGWAYWGRLVIFLFLLFSMLAVILPLIWWLFGWRTDGFLNSTVGINVAEGMLYAPVLEEVLYRLALCSVIAARWGTGTAIVGSGIVFGIAHLIYGNPNAMNLAGGFFLAWAFLKSNSILVPILLHGLGNIYLFLVIELLLPYFC
jgi:membrane protease YdiL (CAAX protease family)